MSDWKENFLPPKGVEHRMGGKDQMFYPVSVDKFVKLRVIGGPLINALTTIFSPNGRENDVKTRVVTSDGTESEPGGTEHTVEEISTGLATLRNEQRSDAIDKAIEAVLSDSSISIVGDLIVDSMREVFPPDNRDNPPGSEVAKTLDVVQLREALMGLAKANAEVFGPLALKVTQAVEEALAKLTPGVTSTTQS